MGFLEAFHMAWEALRGNVLRSALTLIGMVIGIFAIIASVTAVEVIDVYFKERLNFLGTTTLSVSRYPQIQTGPMRFDWRPPITMDQIDRLKRGLNVPADVGVLEGFDFAVAVRAGQEETEPSTIVIGSDENFLGNYSYEVEDGRYFTMEDVQYARPYIVLGASVAEDLFQNRNAIGKEVRIRGNRYEVIGVLVAKGNFLGSNLDNRVFAPVTRLMSNYGNPTRDISSLTVRPRRPEDMARAMDEVISRMRVIRKVEPGEENNFEISTNNTFQEFFDAFTGTLTMAGALIGLIALLAAGIGIMNIMLVSVTERTREIGIRKAVGANRRAILRQFLLEALFLCQVGGLFGILLGVGMGNIVAWYFEISAAIPWAWAIGGVLAVSGIALVFGTYPAFKAAGLDPIDALRYE